MFAAKKPPCDAINTALKASESKILCNVRVHYPDFEQKETFTYANTGGWIESCTCLTEDHSGTFRLIHYAQELEYFLDPDFQNTREDPNTKSKAA